jgi:hypothetical protein
MDVTASMSLHLIIALWTAVLYEGLQWGWIEARYRVPHILQAASAAFNPTRANFGSLQPAGTQLFTSAEI